jgi:hypothetical protein
MKWLDEIATYSSWKLVFVFLLKLELVTSKRDQHTLNQTDHHLCYTCKEPLVGYSKCMELILTNDVSIDTYVRSFISS